MSKKNISQLNQGSHRIALYVRVSTEEQASNPEGSIKSQEQRLRQHVAMKNQEGSFGEVTVVFTDRAKSGKDTNRPELQRLLTAVRKKEVTLVLVSELSRLSRSIRDFCDMWELMRQSGCQFQSLREQFDTTTAAGEMVLFTIANIAQFERKQTSERIVANFTARAERGLSNGGSVPLGYKRIPDKKGHLLIEEEEAKIVREAFTTFLNEGCLSQAGKSLNERGFRLPRRRNCGGDKARLGYFTLENLYRILSNKMYLGVREFTIKGVTKSTKGCWEPIVDEETFNSVQAVLKKNFRRHKSKYNNQRYPFLLSGLAFCNKCGDRLCGKSAHGNSGKVPYYEHSWSTRRQSCLNKKVFACEPNRINAKKLEPSVWVEIERLLENPEIAKTLISDAHKVHEAESHVQETDKLRNKLRGIEEQIEAVAEHLTKLPKSVSPTPIFAQMERLEKFKVQAYLELDTVIRNGGAMELPASLKDYQGYLSIIRRMLGFAETPELKAVIVRSLVHKVEILPDSFRLYYYVGKDRINPDNWQPEPPDGSPGGGKRGKSDNKKQQSPAGITPPTGPFFIFKNFGSKTLTNGAGDGARTRHLQLGKLSLYQMSYSRI